MKEMKTVKEKKEVKKIGFFHKLLVFLKTYNTYEHRQHIEIYTQKSDFVTPVFNTSNRIANCTVGDYVIIIDDTVWVYDFTEDRKEQFSQASYYPEFVRLNPNLFTKCA